MFYQEAQLREVYETFLRDATKARDWLQNNTQLIEGDFAPPLMLEYSVEAQRDIIQDIVAHRLSGAEPDESHLDTFLFAFKRKKDMETFMRELKDVQQLRVCAIAAEDNSSPPTSPGTPVGTVDMELLEDQMLLQEL